MSVHFKNQSNLFNLRVLLRHDEKYGVFVAHCLETGSVVTAESSEDVRRMIQELLEDEILFALKHRNLKNLFSSPAPLDVLLQWMKAVKENEPETIYLDVNFQESELSAIESKNPSIRNRVDFAQAA